MSLWYARAVLEVARGRYPQALAAFGAAGKLAAELARPTASVTSMRARMVQALVRAGHAGRAAAVLAGLDEDERASAEMGHGEPEGPEGVRGPEGLEGVRGSEGQRVRGAKGGQGGTGGWVAPP